MKRPQQQKKQIEQDQEELELRQGTKRLGDSIRWWEKEILSTLSAVDDLDKEMWRPDYAENLDKLVKKTQILLARARVEHGNLDVYEEKIKNFLERKNAQKKA